MKIGKKWNKLEIFFQFEFYADFYAEVLFFQELVKFK